MATVWQTQQNVTNYLWILKFWPLDKQQTCTLWNRLMVSQFICNKVQISSSVNNINIKRQLRWLFYNLSVFTSHQAAKVKKNVTTTNGNHTTMNCWQKCQKFKAKSWKMFSWFINKNTNVNYVNYYSTHIQVVSIKSTYVPCCLFDLLNVL